MKVMQNIHSRRRNCGLTLIEIMVAITVSVVLLAGVAQIFMSSKQSYKLQDSLAYVQENGRFALDFIAQDLRHAGYWGASADASRITGTVDHIAVTGANFNLCAADWGLLLDQRVFGVNNNVGSYACVPTAGAEQYSGGDILALRFATQEALTEADLAAQPAGDLFLRSTYTAGRLFTAALRSDAGNVLDVYGSAQTLHRLQARAYYVGDSGATCQVGTAKIPIPALYRVRLNNDGTLVRERLVSGVEDLQFQYGVDTDTDGVANQYFDAQNVPDFTAWNGTGAAPAGRVVAVRMWILMRAECPDMLYKNTNKYELGDRIDTTPKNDNFRRQIYETTIALRN